MPLLITPLGLPHSIRMFFSVSFLRRTHFLRVLAPVAGFAGSIPRADFLGVTGLVPGFFDCVPPPSSFVFCHFVVQVVVVPVVVPVVVVQVVVVQVVVVQVVVRVIVYVVLVVQVVVRVIKVVTVIVWSVRCASSVAAAEALSFSGHGAMVVVLAEG